MRATQEAEITLEQANAVIIAHREAEYARRAEEARKLIGKCYKYRNSYSPDEKWWLYAIATDVDEIGWLSGVSFQHTSDNRLEIRRKDMLSINSGGWIEITPKEFWKQAEAILAECSELFNGQQYTWHTQCQER